MTTEQFPYLYFITSSTDIKRNITMLYYGDVTHYIRQVNYVRNGFMFYISKKIISTIIQITLDIH